MGKNVIHTEKSKIQNIFGLQEYLIDNVTLSAINFISDYQENDFKQDIGSRINKVLSDALITGYQLIEQGRFDSIQDLTWFDYNISPITKTYAVYHKFAQNNVIIQPFLPYLEEGEKCATYSIYLALSVYIQEFVNFYNDDSGQIVFKNPMEVRKKAMQKGRKSLLEVLNIKERNSSFNICFKNCGKEKDIWIIDYVTDEEISLVSR